MSSESLDRSKLSGRENEIIELASRGLTDQQIAHKLAISPSTVNSYWVRVRGKVGAMSRTEMVARLLREEAREEISELAEKAAKFESAVARRAQFEADASNGEVYRAALEAMPEALLVLDMAGKILFANLRLERMFGYALKDLSGKSIELLIPADLHNPNRPDIALMMAGPEGHRFGIDQVLFGRHRKGHYFRIIVLMSGRTITNCRVTSCLIRSFAIELDDLQHHTRAVAANMDLSLPTLRHAGGKSLAE